MSVRSFGVLPIVVAFLLVPVFALASGMTTKEIEGEIIGITSNRVFIRTKERLQDREEIKVTREGKTIAILRVIKSDGEIIEAEIKESYSRVEFTDKIIKEEEKKMLEEEKIEEEKKMLEEEKIEEEKEEKEEKIEVEVEEKPIAEEEKQAYRDKRRCNIDSYYGAYNYRYGFSPYGY